ncbi:uncharacterized protein LOC142767024 [Rhipicephalus microplus]|uniref:uncharacterized protein LOC142767024 n=1 Tax=Rhipicephalus microplus TaxID=6941 RepID=UPI003F6BDA2C
MNFIVCFIALIIFLRSSDWQPSSNPTVQAGKVLFGHKDCWRHTFRMTCLTLRLSLRYNWLQRSLLTTWHYCGRAGRGGFYRGRCLLFVVIFLVGGVLKRLTFCQEVPPMATPDVPVFCSPMEG